MSKSYEIMPIRSEEDLDKALARGATLEFTAGGCDYNLPPAHEPNSGGWITFGHDVRNQLRNGWSLPGDRYRAIVPTKERQTSLLLRCLTFFRKAA